MTKAECGLAVDAFPDAVKEALARGDGIETWSFGTFKVRAPQGRQGPQSPDRRGCRGSARRCAGLQTVDAPLQNPRKPLASHSRPHPGAHEATVPFGVRGGTAPRQPLSRIVEALPRGAGSPPLPAGNCHEPAWRTPSKRSPGEPDGWSSKAGSGVSQAWPAARGAVPRIGRIAVLPLLALAACESQEPPTACGALPQVTVNAGETATVTACFNDPDGDGLVYSAMSSNTGVATASLSGTTITIRAVAPGSASVTVTASDPGGLEARQSFQVMVPNRAPQPRGTMAPVTVPAGRSNAVDVSSYFTELDGEPLSYFATSSNSAVASVSVAGSTVTVTALAKGTTNVVVTATDPGGLAATQTLQATVPNRAPVAGHPIPDIEVFVGSVEEVDASEHFTDPDGDALAYRVATSATGVARVSASGSTVRVEAVAQGSATVTVTATDPEGLSATQTFRVTVPNRAPVAGHPIPDIEVFVGSVEEVDASEHFTDPDGDALAYRVATSATGVARVSASGSTVRIEVVAQGSTTVTVTATDPEGLSATQTFRVTVPNRAPVAGHPIPDIEVFVGSVEEVDASEHFTDPDGDALAYRVATSATGVARVSASGSTVRVEAVAQGSATVTVTATDPEGLSATQTFRVTVPNRAPVAGHPIPDIEVFVGSVEEVDASEHFTDPDGDALAYRVATSATGVARVSVSGSTVRIEVVAQGSTTVTVTATDPEGLSATQTFRVTVPNRAPVAGHPIPDIEVFVGSVEEVDASEHFTDPDGDALAYRVATSAFGVARVSVSGSTVRIEAVAQGSTTVTVTATDPEGLSARSSFAVKVPNRAPVAGHPIPDRTVRVGDSATFDVSPFFNDPDGDPLTYTASSSNPAVATVSVAGSVVSAAGAGAGSATLTVTATDPGGLSARTAVPLTVLGGVCDRAPQVRDEIVWVTGAASCGAVTDAALAGIDMLDLEGSGITSLREEDFAGLSGLATVRLQANVLTNLPARVFAGLSSLQRLVLSGNRLRTLPAGVFAGLSDLWFLNLSSNDLTTLPPGVFAGLSSLELLRLEGNRLTALERGLFAGLSGLQELNLTDNPGSPFEFALEFDRTNRADTAASPASVRLALAEGAPFAMTVPLSVSGGSASASFASLPAGDTVGRVFTVTQDTAGQPAWVAAGSLSTIPNDFTGITLAAPDTLVLFATARDRDVLVKLYNATDGPNWDDATNWLSERPLNEWYGVSTDAAGRVTDLDLSGNNLTDGPMPPELGQLGSLEVLSLADNAKLVGALTEPMTALTNLRELRAGGTGLCAPTDNPKIRAWLDRIPDREIDSCEPAAAYLTQAVQVRDKKDTVPLVAAEKALLRVFLVAAKKTDEHIPDMRARFYAGGRQVKVIDIPGGGTAIPTAIDEGSLSKSANAEVPGATVQPGLEVVVEVDSVDASLGVPRRIPATGRLKVPVDSVPTFQLTLIPFLYTSKPDSSIIDTVKAMADDPEGHDLLDETRTLLPVESLDVTAHAPVEIGTDSALAVLRKTAAIRVAEKGSGYYKGMMTRFGDWRGVAYVGGWSSASATHARIVAHELGHNMSLWHAPCGNPANVDPNYPHKDGSIGSWGYDFATGRVVSPRTTDVMSYCWDGWWVGGYHFDKAFDHRVNDEGRKTGLSPRAPARSLLLWGGTGPHGRPDLEPVFVVDALPTLPAASAGDHRLRGLDAAGAELFSLRFDMPEIADGGGESAFAFALPADPGWAEALASVTLSGPGGSAMLHGDSDQPMAILLDPRTGQVRAILRDRARAQALAATLNANVLFSRGIPDTDAWRR